jgi:hypothetical protein
MKVLIIYYLIGLLVSLYFIWWYRLSDRTAPKKTDGLGGLIGAWVWPLQIILHIYKLKNK